MNKYFIDTNVILRYLLQDVPVQCREIDKAFSQAKNKSLELVVCQAVIFEAVYTLQKQYKVEKSAVVNFLGKFITIPYLSVEDYQIFTEAFIEYGRHNNVSLVDCFLAAKSQAAGAEVLSFDKHLTKIKKE